MKKLMVVFLAVALLLGIIPLQVSAVTNGQTTVTRLWGQNRYTTATAIADKLASQLGIDFTQGQQFQNVVIASGNNWPDAIAGAPLASQNNAPILLVDSPDPDSQYSNITWDYISQHVNKSGKAFILGGTGVMPPNFKEKLVSLGFAESNIQQLGGKDRNETSLIISKHLNNALNMAYLVSDANFYDALTVASDASSNPQNPVILISNSGVSSEIKNYLDGLKTIITVGDIGASIEGIYARGTEVIKMGKNRYETNSKISGRHVRDESVLLARGDDYPDALAGAVLAGLVHGDGYIILTDTNTLQPETITELNDFAYYEHNPQRWPNASDRIYPNLIVLGGSGAVSEQVVTQVQQILDSDGYPNSQ